MNATNFPTNTPSPSADIPQGGTRKPENRKISPEYMLMLSSVLVNESLPLHIRSGAGQMLKNVLSARDTTGQIKCSSAWLTLNVEIKDKIKQNALLALRSSQSLGDGSCASQVVAAVAAIELPNNQWPDLLELLLGFINTPDITNLNITALQALGFICGTDDPENLHLNEILMTAVQSAKKEEQFSTLQSVATQILFNSPELLSERLDHEGKRNCIVRAICDASKNTSDAIQVGAFECLRRVMDYHLVRVALYMERALPDLAVTGLEFGGECVVLGTLSLWTTIYNKEIELAVKIQEDLDYNRQLKIKHQNFAEIALPEVVPVLLQLLINEEGGDDYAGYFISKEAAQCLSRLALAVPDDIVPAVAPFIETHIKNEDWHYRRAAVVAFDSISGGPDPSVLTPLVTRILPLLISMLSDDNIFVQRAVLRALSLIRGSLIQTDVHLYPLISALVNGLTVPSRVTASYCETLKHLAEQFGGSYGGEDENVNQSGLLSPYFRGIVEALLGITENESKYRRAACQDTTAYYEAVDEYLSAYEATNIVLRQATVDVLPVVSDTLLTVLTRMERLLNTQSQIIDTEERQDWNELARIPCGTVTSAIEKLQGDIQPLANRIMTISIRLLNVSSKTSELVVDTFTVIGALATALDNQFEPYVSTLLPYLCPALKAHTNPELCISAVCLINDISFALREQSKYTGSFMTVLFQILQNKAVSGSVKVSILPCFGDIASVMGPQFEPYFETTMGILRRVAQVEHASQLRESILRAYSGIISGFWKSEKANLLLDHVAFILDFIQRCLKDDNKSDVTKTLSYSLIGSLAEIFQQGQIKSLLLSPWIVHELQAERGMSRTIKRARERVEMATQ